MKKQLVQVGIWPCLVSGLVFGLVACGGSGGGTTVTTETDDGPVVTTESDTTGPQGGSDSVPEVIDAGTTNSGSVAAGASVVYRVPSDAEITLSTTTGDADLYLYRNAELTNDNLLCASRRPFIEDTCTATDADGEMYAQVFGSEPSTYSINVSTDCSVEAVNEWVYRNMQDYYLYADRVPVVNPASYVTTTELIRDLRFTELDPYSGVRDAGGQQAFFEEGVVFGFGFSLGRDDEGNLRVLYAYDDAPFGRAGIKRGDILLGLNNELWDEMSNERYFELVGDEDNPLPNSWQFIDGETGLSKSVNLTQREYRVNTVLHTGLYSNPSFDGKVGHIVFNDFLRISEDELDTAIRRLQEGGATELVMDLRYNPGGYTYIAEKLASQIGGADLAGSTLVRYEYNSKYSSENYQEDFVAESPVLDFDRVVFLTTDRTASSSELLINALSPYIDVTVMGGRTEGKAFISVANQFCGKSLNAMEAQGVNANGVSVAGGIPPTCFAADDYTRDFGVDDDGEVEGMLSSALDYMILGTCNAPVLTKQPAYVSSRINDRPFVGAVAR